MIHKRKIALLDIGIGLLVTGACAYFYYRTKTHLQYQWNWEAIPQFLFRYDPAGDRWVPNVLMQGLFTTVRLSIGGMLLALVIGVVMGLCRVSRSLFNRMVGRTYVELVRNMPPLVLIFIFYYFVSDQIMPAVGIEAFIRGSSPTTQTVLGLLLAPPSYLTAFLSALITLAVFEGAYITEIFRAGIQSIEKGQWEASSALGMPRWQQMRHIILPQAVKRILPPLAGQFISTIKDSAIVSVISIQELTFQSMELMASTYLTFEVWITVTLMYLMLTLTCSLGVERLEIHLRRHEN